MVLQKACMIDMPFRRIRRILGRKIRLLVGWTHACWLEACGSLLAGSRTTGKGTMREDIRNTLMTEGAGRVLKQRRRTGTSGGMTIGRVLTGAAAPGPGDSLGDAPSMAQQGMQVQLRIVLWRLNHEEVGPFTQ